MIHIEKTDGAAQHTMDFFKLSLALIVCIGLSLFVAYKMVLFFSDENEKGNTRRGRAKKFFQNNMGRNEKERKLHNDQFNWEVFKTKMQAHLLPAAIAGLLVGVILNVMTKPTHDAPIPLQTPDRFTSSTRTAATGHYFLME